MRNVKKWLALSLSVAMIFGMVACGNDTPANNSESKITSESTVNKETSEVKEVPKDPVTLEWWYRGNGVQKDTETVEAAFNELLQTYPGMEHVTVNLNPYLASEYKNAVVLAQSAGQQIDLLSTVSLSFAEEVENGTYIAIDDLLAANPQVKDELPDWLWEMAKIDGSTYIVPNYQRGSNQMYFITRADYMDKYGDIEEFRSTLQKQDVDVEEVAALMEKYLLAIREGEGLATKYVEPLSIHFSTVNGFTDRFDTLTGNFILSEGSKTVDHLLMSEDIQKAYEISAEWYEKGYVPSDIMTMNINDYRTTNMKNDASFIYSLANGAGDEETVSAQFSAKYGFDVYSIPLFTNYFIGYTWAAGGTGITAGCENPEEAFRLLELMTTEEGTELYNMVVYGLEGVHYEKIDDTHIKTLEYNGTQAGADSSYGCMAWIMGNTFHKYLNQGCAENENAIALEINENPKNTKSELMGFVPKTADIASQLEQITAVDKEYKTALINGAMGKEWKAYYDEYVTKMKNAGLEDVLKALQSQVDAHLAK